MSFVPDFEIVHMGVNCRDAKEAEACCERFAALFGLARNPRKESPDACFTSTQIEWMKQPGRGLHGHIALATADLPAARAYLEERGFSFDDSSLKFLPDGRPLVLYANEQIGGFSIHLMQK